MVTLNSKSMLKANAAANRMVDKYGHDCTVIVSDTFPLPVPATCLFTRNDLAFQNGTLVLNNNFKILLKAVTLPALLAPLSKIIVNGEVLVAQAVNKLTPDGVNTILWEIEAAWASIPDDTDFIAKPTVSLPANNTSFYTSVEGVGGWSISCQGSKPNTLGDAIFTGSEWQIATDEAFTSIVTTGIVGGTYWVTDSVLARNTSYYIRTRYNSTNAGFSDWSDYSLFNLDAFNAIPITHITTPTITNQVNTAGEIIPYDPYGTVDGKIPYSTTKLANVTIFTTAYEAVSAGDFASVTFQVATDSAFTNLIVDQTQSEGYGYDAGGTGIAWDVTAGFIPENYIFIKGNTYYARVKYTSVDPWDSEWSDTFTFILNAAG
jgi:hypothetical protein